MKIGDNPLCFILWLCYNLKLFNPWYCDKCESPLPSIYPVSGPPSYVGILCT